MREELVNIVYPVFTYGLELRERLQLGERPDLLQEQGKLQQLLLGDLQAQQLGREYGGDPAPLGGMGMDGDNRFMGIRYALVCWLDELFIVDSPAWGADLANLWSARWNAAPLETALYGGAPERAWRFWRQADRAEAIHNDALEAYFLAAMLGFRGDYRFNLGALNTWVARVQDRVARHNNQDYQLPAEQQVPRRSWPLRAREGFQTMVQVLTLAVLVWISILAFAGVYSLR